MHGGIMSTFYFSACSGVPSGVIATIFCFSIAFAGVSFYFYYGEKLTKFDAIGVLFIVVCVGLIGAGGALASQAENSEVVIKDHCTDIYGETWVLLVSITLAIVTGLIMGLNSFSIRWCLQPSFGYPRVQMNADGALAFGIILLPFFIVENALRPYEMWDVIVANAAILTWICGVTSLSFAI